MQEKINREVSLAEAFQKFSENKKDKDYQYFGGTCIELSDDIYEELKKLGIDSKIVACKTNGMLNEAGNQILEYGHFTNIFSQKDENGKKRYSIVDLGMFIPDVIKFYENTSTVPIKLKNGKYAKVEYNPNNSERQYRLCIGKLNRDGEFEYNDYAEFNPNVDLSEKSGEMYRNYFRVAPGYRVVSYDENGSKNHAISIDIKKKTIKIVCDMINREKALLKNIKMADILNGDFDEETLKIACEKLQVPFEDLLYTVKNISQHYNEFVNEILAPEVSRKLTRMQPILDENDIFSKKTLDEFATKKVYFHGHEYNIGFSSLVEKDGSEVVIGSRDDELTLKIDDCTAFSNQLRELINTANHKNMKWLKSRENFTEQEKVDHILKQIWFNATRKDFENPEEFLYLQNNFLKDTTFEELDDGVNLGHLETLDGNILRVQREPQSGSNETPYMLNFDLIDKSNDNVSCDLPSVRYAVDNSTNTAYIYAVQKRKNQELPSGESLKFQKKINRKFFKLNKGILEQESQKFQEVYERRRNGENISEEDIPDNVLDVTPAFLISLNATIGLLKQKGIKSIKVPREMPLRLQVHRRFDEEKRKMLDNNTTKKFVRLFKRLDKHLLNININDSDTSYLEVQLGNIPNKNIIYNPILDEVANLTTKALTDTVQDYELIEK